MTQKIAVPKSPEDRRAAKDIAFESGRNYYNAGNTGEYERYYGDDKAFVKECKLRGWRVSSSMRSSWKMGWYQAEKESKAVSPPRAQWEYVAYVIDFDDWISHVLEMNKLGLDGWELVNVIGKQAIDNSSIAYFKRQLPQV